MPRRHLVYRAAESLWAIDFDLGALSVGGQPIPVIDDVVTLPLGANFAISASGTLTYLAGESQLSGMRTLVWVDREGHEEAIEGVPPRRYVYPRLSPDGTRIDLDVRDQENDIWIWDLVRRNLTRLTSDPGVNRAIAWSPDGRRVAYSAQVGGSENIYRQAADGTGVPERLTNDSNIRIPTSFAPDGSRLLFHQPGSPPYDLGFVALDGERRIETLLQAPFNEHNGAISPEGRWLAYQANESGQDEIYVRPFPDIDAGKWHVSTGGGTRPAWGKGGRELYYFVRPGRIFAVPIGDGPTFSAGVPQVVVDGRYNSTQAGRTYDVTPDGERFLMIKDLVSESSSPTELVVVLNWTEELKRLVPVR